MFLRATDDGGTDLIGITSPGIGIPAVDLHEVTKHLTHRRLLRGSLRPAEIASILFAQRHQNKPRPQLSDSEVRGLEQSPVRDIAKFTEAIENVLPIRRESGSGESSNILKHQSAGTNDTTQLHCPREEITLVVCSE